MNSDNPYVGKSLRQILYEGYEKRFNPDMWRVHIYTSVGITGSIFLTLLPSTPSSVLTGLILATAVFSFHEYLEQLIQNFIDVYSSRYNFSSVHSSPIPGTLITVFLDLIIAVPMFGNSEYSTFMSFFIIIFFVYWIMVKGYFKLTRELLDWYHNQSQSSYIVLGWGVVLVLSVIYISLNLAEFESVLNFALPPESNQNIAVATESFFPLVLAMMIVGLSFLALMYTLIVPLMTLTIFCIWIVIVPYAFFYEPSLLGKELAEMSSTLRLWAGISFLLFYIIFFAPMTISFVTWFQEKRWRDTL